MRRFSVVQCSHPMPFLLPLVIAMLLTRFSFGQNQPPSDPQALSLAAQSIAAMDGNTTVSDVTLNGNATWLAGSDTDTGTATLKALGATASRIDLDLASGTRIEIRNTVVGAPVGQWIDAAGTTYDFVPHNVRTDAAWFFPPLTSLAAGPSVVLSYFGAQQRDGISVQHLHSYVYDGTATTQLLSCMDFYLNASSLLPAAVTFNAHPDGDPNTNIPVEIDFSHFQQLGGIVVPTHIQKYLNRQLILDVTITSAAVNTGLSPSLFQTN